MKLKEKGGKEGRFTDELERGDYVDRSDAPFIVYRRPLREDDADS